ncbi:MULTISPECIES: hypothetical protein [Burkholderia cepacia complex]
MGLQYASKMSESTLNLTSFRLMSAYGATFRSVMLNHMEKLDR